MIRRLVLALALLVGSSSAYAWLAQVPASAPAGYQGPVDIVSGATASWGTRALAAAFADGTHVGIRVKRASDAEVCDVLFTTLGGLGNTVTGTGAACAHAGALATWCSATSVGVVQFYDNTGNGRTAVETSSANEAVLDCSTGALNWATAHGYCTAGTVSLPQTVLASAVFKATASSQFQTVVGFDPTASQMGEGNSANLAFLYGGTTVATTTATDGSLHAVQATWAGASSELYIDGTAHSLSTGTGSSTASAICFGSGASGTDNPFNGDLREATIWPNASATAFAAAKSTLNSNQHTYWGF